MSQSSARVPSIPAIESHSSHLSTHASMRITSTSTLRYTNQKHACSFTCTECPYYPLCDATRLIPAAARPIKLTVYNYRHCTCMHAHSSRQLPVIASPFVIKQYWHPHARYILHQATSMHGTAHPMSITRCVDDHECTVLHIPCPLPTVLTIMSARHCTSRAHYSLC